MTLLAIIDSAEAAAAARARPGARMIATDNPLLSHVEADVENADALIPQAEALALGRQALQITAMLERQLTEEGLCRGFGLEPDGLRIMGPASRLIASLLHRAGALARLLERHHPTAIELWLLDQPRWEPNQPLMQPRFAHPARPLAECGFFGSLAAEFHAVDAPLPKTVNDTAIKDLGRRLAMLPLPLILFELMQRLNPGKTDGRIVVGQENEALRETLPWLALRGIRPRRFGKLAVAVPSPATGFDQPAAPAETLLRAAGSHLQEAVTATGLFNAHQAEALARLILVHLTAGLEWLARQLPALESRLANAFPDQGGMLLTNGLFGTLGAHAYHLCRQRGIQVAEFEHGVTAGISALTDSKLAGEVTEGAAIVLACSDRAAASFRKGDTARAEAIGLPDQVRHLLRPGLQEMLARRALGLGGAPIVMHVSTLPYYGNHRPGLGTPTESTTFNLDRTLLEQVYPRIPHRVLFKQYPTQRFPFEPDYTRLFATTPNITIVKDMDFRYIRAAATVIVTSTPTSTLGWCIGTDRPMIWLESSIINPLSSDELRNSFREAFLVVDIDQSDWPKRLRAMLDRPIPAIEADWKSRAAAREALYRSSLKGPAGSTGRNAAWIIAGMLEEAA